MFNKPCDEIPKQFRRDTTIAMLRVDRDPLQFGIASEAAGQVSGNESNRAAAFRANEDRSFRQRMLRAGCCLHVFKNTGPPVLNSSPLGGADFRQCRDVVELSATIYLDGR